jgi:hypothetical protein
MSLGWIAALAVVIVGGTLIAIVWAPWRVVRDEPPLDQDIATRLLLGEDPEVLSAELEDPDETDGE